MEHSTLVCLAVKSIGNDGKWQFGVAVLNGKDVAFFRVAGRKLVNGAFTQTKEERKPKVGDHLLCQVEHQADGRLRAVTWAFANSAGGVR